MDLSGEPDIAPLDVSEKHGERVAQQFLSDVIGEERFLPGTAERVIRAWRSDWTSPANDDRVTLSNILGELMPFPSCGHGRSALESQCRTVDRKAQYLSNARSKQNNVKKEDTFMQINTPRNAGEIANHTQSASTCPTAAQSVSDDEGSELQTLEHSHDDCIVIRNIAIYSHCEHHVAGMFGTATIAYYPDQYICGLSKLARLADHFARRLQLQERLTAQIADGIQEVLRPKGVFVALKLRHLCIESRGVRQPEQTTTTTAFRGKFLQLSKSQGLFDAIGPVI